VNIGRIVNGRPDCCRAPSLGAAHVPAFYRGAEGPDIGGWAAGGAVLRLEGPFARKQMDAMQPSPN